MHRVTSLRARFCILPFLVLLCLAPFAIAQDEASPDKELSAREVLENRERSEALLAESDSRDLAQGPGESPMASLLSLVEAFNNEDYELAGSFLDLRFATGEVLEYSSADLMRALAFVFDRQNLLDLSSLSDSPSGNLTDDLPAHLDQIGTVVLTTGEVPIYLQQVPEANGELVWKVSSATVQMIPVMWDELGYPEFAEWLSNILPSFTIFDMENWQFVGAVVFFILAWPIASLCAYLLNRLAQLVPNSIPEGIERFFRGPAKFFIFIAVARELIKTLGLSVEARVLLNSSGVDYIAYTVLLLGFITLVQAYQRQRLEAQGNTNLVALMRPITTFVKLLAVVVMGLVWADSAGYNMSAILAGLGVGSLAVALAAQKTLENLIGGITIYAARPVTIGDFCRFGKVAGTVEEIGLRSTNIRTLDRTLLVIPNSMFASTELENYSARDYIRFFRQLELITTDPEQLRLVLAGIRRMFHAHPQVKKGTNSVRLERAENATVVVRIDAGIATNDFQAFLAVAEDINLRIIDIVFAAGAAFASKSQLAVVRGEEPSDPDQKAQVHEMLDDWRAADKLPFPEYSESEIKRLEDSLDYPPRGSSTRKT